MAPCLDRQIPHSVTTNTSAHFPYRECVNQRGQSFAYGLFVIPRAPMS